MQYPIIDNLIRSYVKNNWTGLKPSTKNKAFNGLQMGYYGFADGRYVEYHEYDPWLCSNGIFMECEPGKRYTLSCTVEHGARFYGFVFFNSNKNFIRGFSERRDTNEINFTVTAPNNSKYMVINIATNINFTPPTEDFIHELQVEEGEKTSYIYPFTDLNNRFKLPIMKCHPLYDALISAYDGQQTEEENEILRHYLTPLGIGGI